MPIIFEDDTKEGELCNSEWSNQGSIMSQQFEIAESGKFNLAKVSINPVCNLKISIAQVQDIQECEKL